VQDRQKKATSNGNTSIGEGGGLCGTVKGRKNQRKKKGRESSTKYRLKDMMSNEVKERERSKENGSSYLVKFLAGNKPLVTRPRIYTDQEKGGMIESVQGEKTYMSSTVEEKRGGRKCFNWGRNTKAVNEAVSPTQDLRAGRGGNYVNARRFKGCFMQIQEHRRDNNPWVESTNQF